MKKIVTYKTAKGWMTYQNDPEIEALFGTKYIPTAFTAQATEAKVVSELQRLNPGYVIEVAEEVA